MNIGELAAFICDNLKANGILCTLSGGACVTIYSDNKYQSKDLDFIEHTSYPRRKIIEIMNEIGFTEKNRYFINPETNWFIEFPTGPLAVGSEPITDIIEIEFSTGNLRIISPTDCVKDRLSAYYFWDDLQSLEQAKLVAMQNIVDLNEVERWSKVENSITKFQAFKQFVLAQNK